MRLEIAAFPAILAHRGRLPPPNMRVR